MWLWWVQVPAVCTNSLLPPRLSRAPPCSGLLNWGAPWNGHLRHTLLAPAAGGRWLGLADRPALHIPWRVSPANRPCCLPAGFGGHDLRLSLVSATLGVAATPTAAVQGDGLWQLRQAAAVSTPVQLDAIATEAPHTHGGSPGSTSAGSVQLSAALSPLQLHVSGQQVAVLAAVGAAAAAELSAGFAAPLVSEPPGQGQQQPWLAKFSFNSATGIQLAYAAGGGVQQWHNPHASGTTMPALVSSSSSSADGSSELLLGFGSSTVAVAATPATAATAAAAAAAHTAQPHLVLQLQLEQPRLWLRPSLGLHLPVVEARLGQASDLVAPAFLPEPLLLAAGVSYERSSEVQQGEAWQRQCRASTVKLGSLSLAVSAADYPLLLGLLRCIRQQPALPPRPALVLAWEPEQVAEQQAAVQQQQLAAQPAAEQCPVEEQEQETRLAVHIDAASLTVWPPPQRPATHQQGLAVWFTRLRLGKQRVQRPGGGGSSSTEVTLASAHAALLRHQHERPVTNGGSADGLDLSTVLRFPDAAPCEGPALSLSLAHSWTPSSAMQGGSPSHVLSPSKSPAGSGVQLLQLHATPVSLHLSPELLAAISTVSGDVGSTAAPMVPASQQQQQQPDSAALAAAEASALQGKAALQGVQLLLLDAARWDAQQAQALAIEVGIEEAVLLLQRAPTAENRPWLASGAAAGALLTSVDASLIGASITVRHPGAAWRIAFCGVRRMPAVIAPPVDPPTH